MGACEKHAPPILQALPVGTVRARGWLREQLRLSAAGLTGRMMEVWPDVGEDSAWLGGDGESWERGPYYARGLVALAHTLGDAELIARARPWVDWSLGSQRDDGWFGPRGNDDWWARMPMLDAMRWHHEATGDPRVVPFLGRYFRCQLEQLPGRALEGWARPRGGDNMDSVLWLHERTGEEFLLELADLLHAQTSDWLTELNAEVPAHDAFEFGHGVNRAMGLKAPVVYFQRSRDPSHLAAFRTGWRRTLEHHGQVQGMFSADEFLHGRGSTQGTELCTIVEALATLQRALTISGEMWIGDAIERIAYNALPSILSADHCSHQYFQMPNQVECTPGGRNFSAHHGNDLLFGVAPGFGCCAANLHMGWPRLVNHLWASTSDGGLAAVVLAPCELRATVRNGREVTVVEETDYPFDGEVRFSIGTTDAADFPLSVRVPGWAPSYEVAVNDELVDPTRVRGGLVTIERTWRDGDTLLLQLPMPVRLSKWERESVAVERGPLVYALGIDEEWRRVGGTEPFWDYEVHPKTAWNCGLLVEREAPQSSFRVTRREMGRQPWARDGSPVAIEVAGKRIPEWVAVDGSSGPIPTNPTSPDPSPERLALIPFGCARLRVSMFPVVR